LTIKFIDYAYVLGTININIVNQCVCVFLIEILCQQVEAIYVCIAYATLHVCMK